MIIRKALYEDSEAIAALLMLATGKVIYEFIGEKNHQKALDFLLRFVKNTGNQFSFQNCYVAADGDELLGAIVAYDGADLEKLRKPILDYIHERFNPGLQVENETQAGEFYIDSLGVSPAHQGKGIGSKLLEFLICEKVIKERKTLGLLVDKTNPDAKKLYLKLGFKSVTEKKLMGLTLEHLQMAAV